MPLQETTGAASYDAYGGGPAVAANYIEDVFSTFLYTGNGSTQTITNGIDLSGKGGLVWIKSRAAGYGHYLFDTNRGALNRLASNGTGAESSISNSLTNFLSSGFLLGSEVGVNGSPDTYVSWTFRKAPKFFDVVTYTGNGANRTIAHSLGSVPGCIIVKRTDDSADWQVYHRSNANTEYMVLNSTAAKATGTTRWNSTTPTSTEFSIGTDTTVNASGGTYVAYLFAHDAGGFGASGTDNVISCGSYTDTGSGTQTITLGYEPQWVMRKRTNSADNWTIVDNMRGLTSFASAAGLNANSSGAEFNFNSAGITSTGFQWVTSGSADTYIYIAIRRGPMRTPTTGTSVYDAEAFTGTGATKAITTLSAPDMAWIRAYKNSTNSNTIQVYDRLRGNGVRLRTGLTNGDSINAAFLQFNNQMLATVSNDSETNGSGALNVAWAFKRAPGFFDVVCYTGNYTGGSDPPISHNLGVKPELTIQKRRQTAGGADYWVVVDYTSPQKYLELNTTAAQVSASGFPAATATGFYSWFDNSTTAVAYLFATVAGVSKVGSYTGNGSSQTINCGFTGGSRFVLIKRTDSTGDWYVWDSARGIVAGNDPHLSLNSTAAEVTTDDSVDTDSTGFVVNQVAATNVNVSSATYIFLAIA